jgi:two-component system nitrogen regulation response regulator NtrX
VRGLASQTLAEARETFEREFLVEKLQANGWNISRTAELIGLQRESLSRKIRSLGIDLERDRHG